MNSKLIRFNQMKIVFSNNNNGKANENRMILSHLMRTVARSKRVMAALTHHTHPHTLKNFDDLHFDDDCFGNEDIDLAFVVSLPEFVSAITVFS
jgi:hypothetical protein